MRLFLSQITDQPIRESLKQMRDYLRGKALTTSDFNFVTLTFTAPTTASQHFKYLHKLGYTPLDVILTSVIGQASVQFNYGLFDSQNLDISVTGTVSQAIPTTIRFFVGSYKEDTDG